MPGGYRMTTRWQGVVKREEREPGRGAEEVREAGLA